MCFGPFSFLSFPLVFSGNLFCLSTWIPDCNTRGGHSASLAFPFFWQWLLSCFSQQTMRYQLSQLWSASRNPFFHFNLVPRLLHSGMTLFVTWIFSFAVVSAKLFPASIPRGINSFFKTSFNMSRLYSPFAKRGGREHSSLTGYFGLRAEIYFFIFVIPASL
jgi:predicted small integral membrane protein